MQFLYTRRFLRSFRKLPNGIQIDIAEALDRFQDKKNHKQMRLHKLSGRMKKYHAFSANFSHGIIIEKQKNTVYFIDVGDHTVYK